MTLDISEDLQAEFQFWTNQIGDDNLYHTQFTLGIHDVLKAHFLVAEFFYMSGGGISGVGPRDIDLLHSALLRPHVAFGGKEKWQHPLEKCATMFFGIIKDHPFHDANKRTAFLSLIYNLYKLNLVPTPKNKELEDFAVCVADNQLNKYRIFKDLCKENDPDPEIKTIHWFLKGNTRKLDTRFYSITYARLKKTLNRFGFDLQNPSGNTIDVVRIEERRRVFGIVGPKEKVGVKVAQIGFPSWTKEVGQGAIKTVREKTGLTAKKGVDSATFFKDEDPVHCLIAKYQEPLISLAHR
ncbi:type II toxin-antitoxin system death-on-curing family toxin [Rhodovibrio salinarum]|uniref:Type II toxin-antitoxin system death-on-curing family toxin n=1 Tax=Rhodovibrio salinarum TaxID=1087 RepID=A0A934QLU6_9PROT|nr:type II toxin-antitoxin system death-on-curing family toxin [Rhodovibrio salinarum]MBK1699078.1 type II toxin-antitoxin system death-on-curing family toxin [Rhodovibrio salinarum]